MRLGLSKGQSTMAGDVLGLGAWNCLHLRAPVYTGNKGPMVAGHLRSPRQPHAAMTIRYARPHQTKGATDATFRAFLRLVLCQNQSC